MSDKDFDIWKKSPHRFYSLYSDIFHNIITKKIFSGHRNKKDIKKLHEIIRSKMFSDEAVHKLSKYQPYVSFLIFYSSVLEDVLTDYSQKEDLELVGGNYNQLILKYYPLIKMLSSKILSAYESMETVSADLIQQTYLNILAKQEKIVSSYDRKRLFRNYIWEIIKNEFLTLLNRELKEKYRQTLTQETEKLEKAGKDNPFNKLLISDAFRLLEIWLKSYLHRKYKLIFCIKLIFGLQMNRSDITTLIQQYTSANNELEYGQVIEQLLILSKNGGAMAIKERIKYGRILLNRVEQSATDEDSYWRWTNYQVDGLIRYLNNRHFFNFNRESVKVLVEWYFENKTKA